MYNFFQTNEQFMQWSKEEALEWGNSIWCGSQMINDKTGDTVPELRLFDENGGCFSATFYELQEIDALIGELYVLRRTMEDNYVFDVRDEEPGFYPRNAKLKLVP